MLQGSIGKKYVVKHYPKRIVITKFPNMTAITASAEQQGCRNRFKNAVAYARDIMGDPAKKAALQQRVPPGNSLYHAAIKEYIKSGTPGSL